MRSAHRHIRHQMDIWPGFVDGLATLLMVFLFVLTVFVLAQFFLGEALSGRERSLKRLGGEIGELAELLNLERKANADLKANLASLVQEFQTTVARRDELTALFQASGEQLAEANQRIAADKEKIDLQIKEIAQLAHDVQALRALKEELDKKVASSEAAVIGERRATDAAKAEVALLNKQLTALRDQLSELTALLGQSEKIAKEQKVELAALGQRLNAALAGKVQELSRYRSEFFGRLREVLGNQPGVQIVGDRFVFQSEVLFEPGSAEIGEAGLGQLARVADTLKEVADKFPADLPWVLRVDGHTDKRPIRTQRFPSNWELSTARAISVVRYFMTRGIAADRLAANGFAEFQPLDGRDDEVAFRRNRRIEIKITDR